MTHRKKKTHTKEIEPKSTFGPFPFQPSEERKKQDSLIEESASKLLKFFPRVEYSIPSHIPADLTLSFTFLNSHEKTPVSDEILNLIRSYLFEDHIKSPTLTMQETLGDVNLRGNKAIQLLYTFKIYNEVELEIARKNLDKFLKIAKKTIRRLYTCSRNLFFSSNLKQITSHIYPYIERFPQFFNESLIEEANRFSMMIPSIFLQYRKSRYISRIILGFHYGQKKLELNPDQFAHIHLNHQFLDLGYGSKSTYGVCITLKELPKFDIFSQETLFALLTRSYKQLRLNEKSFVSYKHPDTQATLIYFEFTFIEGHLLTSSQKDEIYHLLQDNIDHCIMTISQQAEARVNDEDILKNIATLSQEIEQEDDLPQVSIHYQGQDSHSLFFIISIVRPQKADQISFNQLFKSSKRGWYFSIERQGETPDPITKLTKESCVCTVVIQKNNLTMKYDKRETYEKTQEILDFLEQNLEKIRAFNGSFIGEQLNAFKHFSALLTPVESSSQMTIEQLFFNISPTEYQFLLSSAFYSSLYEFYKETENNPTDPSHLSINQKSIENYVCTIMKAPANYVDEVKGIIYLINQNGSVITSQVEHRNHHLFIFIWNAQEYMQESFNSIIELLEKRLIYKTEQNQTLSVSCEKIPLPLDPRQNVSVHANRIFKFIFEGLMKPGENGVPEPALAETTIISEDKKRYTFNLRDARWSNGDQVTAHDFVHAWRQVLNPDFDTSFAYLFYPIRNARKAKIGEVPIDQIGVKALDSRKLEVSLDYPCPHFLYLLTLNIFCPVNRRIDTEDSHWYLKDNQYFVCNGPFRPLKQGNEKTILIKNRLYHDSAKVKIETIEVHRNPVQSIQQTMKGSYGWVTGVPIEERISQYENYHKITTDQYSTWLRPNVHRYPFNNKYFRKALCYAINRDEIQKEFPYLEKANHFLPSTMAAFKNPQGLSSYSLAKDYLSKAKVQLGIPAQSLVKIELLCPNYYEGNFYQIINLIQDQLFRVGIQLDIKLVPITTFFERSVGRHYQLRTTSWGFLIDTPFYLLDTFYSPTHTDLYLWTSSKYQKYYQQWCNETEASKRLKIQASLEKTIIDEQLAIPLFFENYIGLIRKDLKGVKGQAEASLDFTESYIEHENLEKNPPITWINRWQPNPS